MKVLIIEPRQRPRRADIPHTLRDMQRTVGGYIEVVRPFDDPVVLVCDEEGKLKGYELNPGVAATAPFHYPRTNPELTWDYYLDTDGNPVFEGHDPNNYYYLISDDNILIMNRSANRLSKGVRTWKNTPFQSIWFFSLGSP